MIAACLVGLVRTFSLQKVRRNIYDNVIQPNEPYVDVFAFIKGAHLNFSPLKPKAVAYRSVNDSLTALTSHTGCRALFEAYEIDHNMRYDWVLKLRTDVVYFTPIRNLSGLSPKTNVVFVEACGAGRVPPMTSDELRTKICRSQKNRKYGCAKDTWGFMSRDAADVYFDQGLLDSTRAHPLLNHVRWFECRLGVALHSRNVTVKLYPLRRKICRSRSCIR